MTKPNMAYAFRNMSSLVQFWLNVDSRYCWCPASGHIIIGSLAQILTSC